MKKSLKALAVGILFAASLVLAPSVKAEAYGLEQTNLATNSITIRWQAEPEAIKYNVYIQNESYEDVLYTTLPASQTSLTLPNLPAGSEKDITVKYVYLDYDNEENESYVGYGDFRTLPGKVTNVRQEKWWYFIEQLDAVWDLQSAVDGYEYYIKTTKGKVVEHRSGTVRSASCAVSNSKIYTVEVRAYSTINGQTYYGPWSDKAYCFTQPRIKSLKKSGKKITVKWGKVEGATGYDIYVSTKPKTGYKKVKTVKANKSSYTITKIGKKKLSAKKKYYVYIATVKKVGGRRYDSGKLYYWNTKSGANSFNYF